MVKIILLKKIFHKPTIIYQAKTYQRSRAAATSGMDSPAMASRMETDFLRETLCWGGAAPGPGLPELTGTADRRIVRGGN